MSSSSGEQKEAKAKPQSPSPAKRTKRDRLVWIDCEMTGLDVETEHLLEIARTNPNPRGTVDGDITLACIITDEDLNTVAEGPNIVIHQPDEILEAMGEWCTETHGKSGLTASVRRSKISLEEAEIIMTEFVSQHTNKGQAPLAGNSVHADKKFLEKYMPTLVKELHYRIVDVSTVKELCRRWYGREFSEQPKKQLTHRAIDDIRESIQELKYYRKAIFKQKEKSNGAAASAIKSPQQQERKGASSAEEGSSS